MQECGDAAPRWHPEASAGSSGNPRTTEGSARWCEYIRFAHWKQMVGTSDRWMAFCNAAQQVDDKTRPVKEANVEIAAQDGLTVVHVEDNEEDDADDNANEAADKEADERTHQQQTHPVAGPLWHHAERARAQIRRGTRLQEPPKQALLRHRFAPCRVFPVQRAASGAAARTFSQTGFHSDGCVLCMLHMD